MTILFTDMVDSTRLFAGVSPSRANRLREEHFSLLRRVVAFHRGHEVKTIGDSFMVMFDSATDAVRCAIDIQRGVDEDNRRRRVGPISVRIGIGTGDVTGAEDDYFGGAVVEARRLCDTAPGGSTFISEVVRALAASHTGDVFEDAGQMKLKGFEASVPVTRVLWRPESRRVIRVVMADDAALVREGVARLLEDEGFEVVAQAADARELVECVLALRPDIAITDVRMPPANRLDGLEAAQAIRERCPGVAVLLLSQHLETEYALRLLRAGRAGFGYVLKERVMDVGAFADVVRRVATGGVAIDDDVIAGLLARANQGASRETLSLEDLRSISVLSARRDANDRVPAGEAARALDAIVALAERLDASREPRAASREPRAASRDGISGEQTLIQRVEVA